MSFRAFLFSVLTLVIAATLFAHDGDHPEKHVRSPRNLGDVLVFSGTGWYRHPETASINGWLAQLSNELGMQVDVTETPKDLTSILEHYDVLVINNCNELTSLLTPEQMQAVEDWYNQGGGIVALHAAIVHQTKWTWFTKLAGCDFDSDSEYMEARVVVDSCSEDPSRHQEARRIIHVLGRLDQPHRIRDRQARIPSSASRRRINLRTRAQTLH